MAAATAAKSLQSCPTLCDPTDDSPPGSPVPGVLQARTQEWVVKVAERHVQDVASRATGHDFDLFLPPVQVR